MIGCLYWEQSLSPRVEKRGCRACLSRNENGIHFRWASLAACSCGVLPAIGERDSGDASLLGATRSINTATKQKLPASADPSHHEPAWLGRARVYGEENQSPICGIYGTVRQTLYPHITSDIVRLIEVVL
jgi:hypothetical protein